MNKMKVNSLIALSTATFLSCAFSQSSTIYAVDENNSSVENSNEDNTNLTSSRADDNTITDIDSSTSDSINVSTALNNSIDNNTSKCNNNSTSESNNNTSNPSEINNCNTNSTYETNISDNINPINNSSNTNEDLTEQAQIISENNEENSTILCDNTQLLSIGNIAQVNYNENPYESIQRAKIPEILYVTADNSNNSDPYSIENCIDNLQNCTTSAPISITQLNYLIEKGLKFNHNCTIRFKNGDTFYQPFQYSTTSPTVQIKLTNYQGNDHSTTHPVFSRVRILENPAYDIWTNGVNFSSDDISTDDRNIISEDKLGKIWCIDLVNHTDSQYSWIIDDSRFKGTKNNFVDYDNSLGRMVQTSNNIGFIYDKGHEKLYGNKVSSIDKLNNNFDFYSTEKRLYVYCNDIDGPSKVIPNMYFALPSSLLTVKSNTIVDGIDFEYTGCHAISGDSGDPNLKDIEIKNCNINYIGGCRQINSGDRLGNGIEFFMYGSNIDIHDNIISNCYDTATTLQGPNGNWNDISIHNNKFSNNSQSFEVWSKLENGKTNADHRMSNITFANNLCVDQGRGWGYDTRPDKDRASDIEIQLMQLDNWNISINNNTFFNPRRVFFFDDTNNFKDKIKNNLFTCDNKIYLASQSEDSNLLHSGNAQYTYDYEKNYHDNFDNSYSYDESKLNYMIDLNIGRSVDNMYADTTYDAFKHFKQLGNTFFSNLIDIFSSESYGEFADRYNKNTNDIAYVLEDAHPNANNSKIITSIKYIGSGTFETGDSYIANLSSDYSNNYAQNRDNYGDASKFTQFCQNLNDKVYIKSIKYPYAIYDINTTTNDETDTTNITDNPLKLLTSQDIKFDYDLTSQTTSDTITVNKDHTIANTEYTWFINDTNSLKNATKINSDQISDSNEATSITPRNESGEKYYFCVASYDSGDTRTASIVKAVEVNISEGTQQGGDTQQGGNQGNQSNQGGHHSSSGGSSSHSSSSSSSSSSMTESSYENTNNNNTSNSVTDKQEYIYKFDSDLNSFIKIAITQNQTDVHINSTNSDSNLSTTNDSAESYITYDKPQTALEDNSWNKINGNQWCYIKNGTPAKGWITIDNTKYHFNNKKIMDIGWIQDNNNWYYLNPNSDGTQGALQTGWIKDNNNWYYLDSSTGQNQGIMKTGWIQNNNNWYFLNPNGSMKTGWLYWNSKWYYLDSDGSMKTGWKKVDNKWYYFYEDGSMALNTTINGYILGHDGAMR